MLDDYDYSFKIIIIGESGVGKSGIFSRFTRNYFDLDTKATLGVEFFSKSLKIKGKSIKAQVWDTAGQERFRALTKSYYKGAAGVLLVFDITNRDSFKNLDKWIEEVREHGEKDHVSILIGNKCDLESQRAISTQEAMDLAKEYGLVYIETSAKENKNVADAFEKLMMHLFEKNDNENSVVLKKQGKTLDIDIMQDTLAAKKNKKKCC